METFETEPTTDELYDHEEEGEKNVYEKFESIYLVGRNKPTYIVGTDDVWASDKYLCVRVHTDGHEQEIHKIAHERVRRRRYVVTMDNEEERSNLANTANAEILDL